MGCDGGTIPTRIEQVSVKKKPEQKDKTTERIAKWETCQLSTTPLQPPIVACELGKLYNKESVIELLLDRSAFDTTHFDHIRSLKDVHELQLTPNASYTRKRDLGDSGAYNDTLAAKNMCPVTGLEMSGRYTFVYLVKCGCVFSERALKEVKADVCHKCSATFSPVDIVILNPTEDDDADAMKANMETRKQQTRLEKKAKKSRKHAATTEDGPTISKQAKVDAEAPVEEPRDVMTKSHDDKSKSKGGPNNKSKKSKDFKLIGKEIKSNKESKEEVDLTQDNYGYIKQKGAKSKFQNDPTTSNAYKELFTSHPKAKNQLKAHWVTCDPCHR